MARQDLDLSTLLDIPLWEKVQDQLAEYTGTAIITIDYKGNPITKHSCRTEFCSVIREDPVARKRCDRCDALAGLEAVRLGRPYIYLCHCGIVDVAVPILVGDRYLGAVMFGQVRIPNGDDEAKVVRLVNEISSIQSGCEETRRSLMKKFEKLPEMEYERIEKTALLIDSVVSYVVDSAVKKRNEAETYNWLLRMSAENGGSGVQELRPSPKLNEPVNNSPVSKNSAVYPAVAYIDSHPAPPSA